MVKRRKIRVFLGGRINDTQAQNLTSRALARFLDKEKFEVGAMTVFSGDIPTVKWSGVKYFPVRRPARFWSPLRYLQGILWCDVAYLTAGPERWKMYRFFTKIFRKKAFNTIECVYSGVAKQKSLEKAGSLDGIVESLTWTGNTYSITHAMVAKNKAEIGLDIPDKVLYLGVDSSGFSNDSPKRELTDVLMIGGDLRRKRVCDFLELSRKFPSVKFHIVGGNIGNEDYKAQIARDGGGNVEFHGPLPRARMFDVVKMCQLHVFPSRDEGFPKVTLDCAAAGVPSLVYSDYGADEWITSGKDGYVVKTIGEMAAVIEDLIRNPGKLQPLSDGAREMAQRWDWRTVVKDWEREIESLVASH